MLSLNRPFFAFFSYKPINLLLTFLIKGEIPLYVRSAIFDVYFSFSFQPWTFFNTNEISLFTPLPFVASHIPNPLAIISYKTDIFTFSDVKNISSQQIRYQVPGKKCQFFQKSIASVFYFLCHRNYATSHHWFKWYLLGSKNIFPWPFNGITKIRPCIW